MGQGEVSGMRSERKLETLAFILRETGSLQF